MKARSKAAPTGSVSGASLQDPASHRAVQQEQLVQQQVPPVLAAIRAAAACAQRAAQVGARRGKEEEEGEAWERLVGSFSVPISTVCVQPHASHSLIPSSHVTPFADQAVDRVCPHPQHPSIHTTPPILISGRSFGGQ